MGWINEQWNAFKGGSLIDRQVGGWFYVRSIDIYVNKEEALEFFGLSAEKVTTHTFLLEPRVIKGKPKTLDEWILWKIEAVKKQSGGEIIYGTQIKLIKDLAILDIGYKDTESIIKKRWEKLGISTN